MRFKTPNFEALLDKDQRSAMQGLLTKDLFCKISIRVMTSKSTFEAKVIPMSICIEQK